MQVPLSRSLGVYRDHGDAVRIMRRGLAAERHREAAIRRPSPPGARHGRQRITEIRVDIGVGQELQTVAEPLQSVARLSDLADPMPLEGEGQRIEDGLVAQVEPLETESCVEVS